ncbi:hypothetical protein CACET_c15970 [Clostridium aceticum]|uniref:Uncharacterized protein n=1 Tax=Clostridium aceticum TaxID=84022 RepID=A0A0D8IFH1_9CLOT|nr:hypothetical protein [Clostridium aceticum]AKL95046.1 hypothetical protein CACET_c15970 [Clostridium aceticum]KJF27936.1 hypothetical protein TZ02_05035 [Clostridium aceticum]
MRDTKLKKKIAVTIGILILGLWVGGIIPQQIGKMAAINYVEKNHGNMGLTFMRMEFSSVHGDYFAVFQDSDEIVYSFLITSKYLPITVLYDPINLPE